MHDSEGELQKEIKSFHEGSSSLEQIRDLAGNIGDQGCLSAAPILLQLLQHEDEIVRYHAVTSLGFDLRFKAATNALIRLLKEDADVDCRDAAAGALSAMWRNTRDYRIIKELSNAALDDLDEDVRKSAYSALIVVAGISDEEYLEMLRHERRPVDPARITSILAGEFQ